MIDYTFFFKDYTFPFAVEEASNGWQYLMFPLLYADHDCIGVYVKYDENAGTYLLTDDGETLGVHCCFDKKRHTDILQKIVACMGVECKEDELFAVATDQTFSVRLIELVSTILAVDTVVHAQAFKEK